jgi:hypothetical protein
VEGGLQEFESRLGWRGLDVDGTRIPASLGVCQPLTLRGVEQMEKLFDD